MCDQTMSMPYGAECDPSTGSYEHSPVNYSGIQPQNGLMSSNFMPMNMQSQANTYTSGYFPSNPESNQMFNYHPNSRNETASPQEFYYSQPSTSAASSQSLMNFGGQQQGYNCYQMPQNEACGPGQPVMTEPYPTFEKYNMTNLGGLSSTSSSYHGGLGGGGGGGGGGSFGPTGACGSCVSRVSNLSAPSSYVQTPSESFTGFGNNYQGQGGGFPYRSYYPSTRAPSKARHILF